ncbi:hypothetical protein A0256_11280 [Mucilaginibacter sp. PAMC 26640]|nr:hypothetical protein A0256_11280 [Mucilaginibacter sp. PAMC 26640]
MDDQTSWTPSPDDNIKGITDKKIINEFEAKGIAAAELFILELDNEVMLSTSLILEIHRISFSQLYDWAGKWRTNHVIVGQLDPPKPTHLLQQLYQFIDNLNFRLSLLNTREDHLNSLVYAHYEFIRIHPFNNGNGRTGRLFMNIIALKFGYRPLQLYHSDGESRQLYINAMKSADKGDFKPLEDLIAEELSFF